MSTCPSEFSSGASSDSHSLRPSLSHSDSSAGSLGSLLPGSGALLFENTALDHDLFLLYVCGMVSLVRTAYGPKRHEEDMRLKPKRETRNQRNIHCRCLTPSNRELAGPVCCQSYMW
ncbi:hypothetical protein EYF80_013653 [Liparis tanakae]|uniref:Uncharacterized protein n=1 Tax=Liparis tanakae TaxID=230148 RepID=A0A4Z2IFQ2_9TELE|nr:hypothetical protein EYF80_013653 [Liparis tanakae]